MKKTTNHAKAISGLQTENSFKLVIINKLAGGGVLSHHLIDPYAHVG
jgi:hypothetical protein